MGHRVSEQCCNRCAQLEAENERLRSRIRHLEERIRQIQRAIKTAFDAAVGIEHGVDGKMNDGGLPRGSWSYLKGLRTAASLLRSKIAEALYA